MVYKMRKRLLHFINNYALVKNRIGIALAALKNSSILKSTIHKLNLKICQFKKASIPILPIVRPGYSRKHLFRNNHLSKNMLPYLKTMGQ